MVPRNLIAMLMLGAASTAQAVSVSLPATPGFKVGNQATNGRAALVELVPTGEIVTNFTKLITLQTLPGGAAASPAFIAEWTKRYLANCPGAQAAPIVLGGGNSGVRIGCARHPATGKPETVFARALAAGPDMAFVHITIKAVALPQDAAWARDYLGRVHPQ